MEEWPEGRDKGNLLLRILLFPVQAVVWIASLALGLGWLLVGVAIGVGIPVAVGFAVYHAVTGDDGGAPPEVRSYVSEALRIRADFDEEWERFDSSFADPQTLAEHEWWAELERMGREGEQLAAEEAGAFGRLEPPPELRALHDELVGVFRGLSNLYGDIETAALRRSYADVERAMADYFDMLNEVDALEARWAEALEKAGE